MGLRTIVLKLHKPGKSKRKILDEAILNYNKAYQYLLARAYLDLEEIEEKFKGGQGLYNAGALSKWVSKEISMELNKYDVQPFKDSLKLELGMTLASYLRLKVVKDKVGFPNEGLIDSGKLRPIYFCRYDIKRSYCLLYDSKKNRYFAKLYLMNCTNAKLVNAQDYKRGKLAYVHNDNRLLERDKKKETFIIVPLSFGKYQEEFLRGALDKPESLRTAKLIRKRSGYYLAVSIDTGKTESVKTDTFLGVARGLKNRLNYTIVDLKGHILNSGPVLHQTVICNEYPIPSNELHKAANSIVNIALKNKSQVILQNLIEKGDGINRVDGDKTDYQPEYKRSTYIQLTKLLEYKLPEKGLPSPVKVSSVDIFYSCHACGFNSRRNRLTKDIFICTNCGAAMEIDNLGSLNLARKLINYSYSTIKIKVFKTPEGAWFTNKLLGLNYFIPNTEDQLQKLKEEIQRIVEGIKNSIKDSNRKGLGKKISIIKKFDSSEDFINLIEFV